VSTLSLFEGGTPTGPGVAVRNYTEAARGAAGRAVRWHVDPGNLGLLSRAAGELPALGATALEIVLAATDHADDRTEVLDECELAPTLRRLRDRAPPGLAVRLALPDGRPYVLPPPALDISTNDLCGLACVMCGNRQKSRDPLTMPPSRVRGLIEEAFAWGIRRVALTGSGEPFRDPELMGHAELASSLGHLVTITTNGFPVSEDLASRVAGLHASVSVSIHGASDATHDAITGVAKSAENAWRAVRRLVAARDRLGRRGPFSVNVSSVIQRQNAAELGDLVRRALAEGCDGHNLQPVNLQHGFIGPEGVKRRDDAGLLASLWPRDRAVLDAMADDLLALRRAHGSFLHATEERIGLMRRYFDTPTPAALGLACQVGERFLAVDHRGRIKPCYRLPWDLGDASIGRLRGLWNSMAYARIRGLVSTCPLVCLNNCFHRK
jgi:MoaA/NifB/PqqE/SkfB family radical SAM enzyme